MIRNQLVQGIWYRPEQDKIDKVETIYRPTTIGISNAEEALMLLRAYLPQQPPDVVVIYEHNSMFREWRLDKDYIASDYKIPEGLNYEMS